MADILLVQMPAKKRSADAACDCSDRTARYCVTDHRAPYPACNRTNSAISAAATMG